MHERRGVLFFRAVCILMAIITYRYIRIEFLLKKEQGSFIMCRVSTYQVLVHKR